MGQKMSVVARTRLLVIILLACLPVVATAAAPVRHTVGQVASALDELVPGQGGRLSRGLSDVLIEAHGHCAWLDNTAPDNDFFVPFSTPVEWQAFIDHAPDSVVRGACCPATQLTMNASDGQPLLVDLPVGRVGATGPNGVVSISHAFQVTRPADGASWVETLSGTLRCQYGAWNALGVSLASSPPPLPTPNPVGPNPVGPSAPVIAKIMPPDCRTADGQNVGACHWSENGDDVMAPAVATRQWDNALYACRKAGFDYLVAATGSDYDDCTSCKWVDWVDASSSALPLDQLSTHSIPPVSAASWARTSYGNFENNGALHAVWCSDTPNMRLPPDCPATTLTVETRKLIHHLGVLGIVVTRIPATFTAQLPDGYLTDKRTWEVMRPIHPTDSSAVSSRRNDAHLYRVGGTLQPNGQGAQVSTRYAECTPQGWKLYHACKGRPILLGLETWPLGTVLGGPGTATCTNDVNDFSYDGGLLNLP